MLVLLTCVGCDQAAKAAAKDKLADSPPISLLNDAVRFEYTENHGAMLSLGANLPEGVRFLLLVVFVGAALAATVALLLSDRRASGLQLVGLSLLAGGGIGNLVDRVTNHGAAVDFVSLGIGRVRTGIFNVADVAIIAGMLMFVLFSPKRQEGA